MKMLYGQITKLSSLRLVTLGISIKAKKGKSTGSVFDLGK